MGSPVLGAIVQGAAVVTKHAADLIDDETETNLWDLYDDEEDVTPKEKEVKIEVVYKTSSN